MQVAKWGNSLAVRLPSAVVEALDLKEGDQIEIRVAGTREFEIARNHSIEKALERIRQLRRPLPAGFKVPTGRMPMRDDKEVFFDTNVISSPPEWCYA